jgi:hypothetical protein
MLVGAGGATDKSLISSIAMAKTAVHRPSARPVSRARALMCWLPALALVGGCASTPQSWTRSDGGPISPDQLALDEKGCQAERQNALLAASDEPGFVYGANGLSSPRGDAFDAVEQAYAGCMTQRGYNRPPQ